MAEYTLGRLNIPDERDRSYPMRTLLPKAVPIGSSKTWYTRKVLDQGSQPRCVAYAWAGWQIASPTRTYLHTDTSWLYNEAQKVDDWPGENYDGTSVRAGAKVLQDLNRIGEYRWANSIIDIHQWLISRGTVVLGTSWHRSMFEPDSKGYIHPDGDIVGGHAYLCIGYSYSRKAFRCLNSWGPGWGQKGRFWVGWTDLQGLLADDGEACAAVEV